MQRYEITNKNLKREIKEFSLYENGLEYPNSADESNGYLEFYMNAPHHFINGEEISVNFNKINLANNIKISLRPEIMIGLVLGDDKKPPKYLWCYENDTTLWYEIFETEIVTTTVNNITTYTENIKTNPISKGKNGVLDGYLDSIESTVDNSKIYDDTTPWKKTFRTFRITISNDGKQVKELHSNTWQDLTTNNITLDCGFFCGLSIAYTCLVSDTYFRIPYIDLKRDVNILRTVWDLEKKEFIITTDYGYDYTRNEWVDKKLSNDMGNKYELCMNVSYIPSFYIPQSTFSESNYPIRDVKKLFSYHDETIKTKTNKIGYDNLSITLENPCYNDGIEYKFTLNDNKKGVRRIELNCAGEGYKDGIYDIGFKYDFAVDVTKIPQGYFTVKDGMVMDIVLTKFGEYEIVPKIDFSSAPLGGGAMATAIMYRDDFSNISEMFLIYKKEYLSFYKTIANYSVNINISQDYTLDSMRTDLLDRFIEVETEKAINPILDNERIRFEPVFKTTQNNKTVYYPINRINYQFHFNKEEGGVWVSDDNITKLLKLGFSDNDVLYKKKVLSKTFCRQSFYNNFNPTQYKLECFNSVYINIDNLYSNYILNISNVSDNPINGIQMLGENMNAEFTVFNPLLEKFTNTYRRNNIETTVEYIQSSSSEGYYLYLFGEEYKQLIPSKLYMKMEFNNARNGKRTLFFNRKPENVNGVKLNNVFFKSGNSKQYMYTEIIVCGVKVKWNNTRKYYEQVTNENDVFEVKYFWYPVVEKYPIINFVDEIGTTLQPSEFKSIGYPNIFWGNKTDKNGYIMDPDILTMKFYEAIIE